MKASLSRVLLVVVIVVIALLCGLTFKQLHEAAPPAAGQTFKTMKIGCVEWARLTVLIDNNPNPANPELKHPWGISIYLETPSRRVLFDAGCSASALRHNAKLLGVNLSEVDFIVISHEHGDHIEGLSHMAEVKKGCTVYVPNGMSLQAKEWILRQGFKLAEVENTTKVAEGVAIVGQLYGPPYEQALAVNVSRLGIILVVGCSHPGVENFVAKAKQDLGTAVYAVIGGFHLAGASYQKLNATLKALIEHNVAKIYPLHCSGAAFRDLVRKAAPERYGDGHVGLKAVFMKT
ncbi:MAG TPA: MBL fold metallo-hydrolase [Candidatus Methanomethylia archaeon]|nr:MBL fold metallo-hydrolase [Candidatus Methanomethylicia archaeon]